MTIKDDLKLNFTLKIKSLQNLWASTRFKQRIFFKQLYTHSLKNRCSNIEKLSIFETWEMITSDTSQSWLVTINRKSLVHCFANLIVLSCIKSTRYYFIVVCTFHIALCHRMFFNLRFKSLNFSQLFINLRNDLRIFIRSCSCFHQTYWSSTFEDFEIQIHNLYKKTTRLDE